MIKNPFGEEIFTTMPSKSPLEQLEAFSFCPISCTGEKTEARNSHLKSFHSEPDQRPGYFSSFPPRDHLAMWPSSYGPLREGAVQEQRMRGKRGGQTWTERA